MSVMASRKAMIGASSSSGRRSSTLSNASDKGSFGRKAITEGGGSRRGSQLNLNAGSFLKRGVHESFVEREQMKIQKMVEKMIDDFMIEKEDLDVYLNAFQQYDADGSGDIDSGELQLVLEDLGQHCSERQIRDMIRVVDRGGTGSVSLPVFLRIMCDPRGPLAISIEEEAKIPKRGMQREDPRQARFRRKMGEIKKKLAAREATRNVQMVQTINVSGGAQVTCLSLSSDGCTLAAATDNNRVTILRQRETVSGPFDVRATIGHPHIVTAVGWTQDARGHVLGTCCVDRNVRIWRQDGKGLLEVTVRACDMGGVREKGVSSVHAAVSVDGVVRIGKSQPFTNEVEWDGEDAMDLLFDVPNAGTDVEVIIYLNENKEDKAKLLGKDYAPQLLDRVSTSDSYRRAGFWDPSKGREGVVTKLIKDKFGEYKEALVAWDVETGAKPQGDDNLSVNTFTTMGAAELDAEALAELELEDPSLLPKWPSRTQEDALPIGLGKDPLDPRKNVMYSLRLCSRSHSSVRVPVSRAVLITELSGKHGGGGKGAGGGKGGDWFEARAGPFSTGKVTGGVFLRCRWIDEPSEWIQSGLLKHEGVPTGLSFCRGAAGELLLITCTMNGLLNVWHQTVPPYAHCTAGESLTGRSEWCCVRSIRGVNNVRFKGLGMLYGDLPDEGIPVSKDEKGEFKRGRGKGFKVGMGRRGSIINESRFDEDGNLINSEGGGGHGFLGDAEGLMSRVGSAEGGMFDGGEGLISRPGSSAVVDAGGGVSQMTGGLDDVDLTLSGVDDATSNTLETPVVEAAPVVGKTVRDPDAHRVETSHRVATSRESLDKTLRMASSILLIGDDKCLHSYVNHGSPGEGDAGMGQLTLDCLIEGAGGDDDEIDSGFPRICTSPTGGWSVLVAAGNEVQEWNTSTEELGCNRRLLEHRDRVRSVAWRGDMKLQASCDQCAMIKIWAWCGDPSVFVKQKESMGSSNWKCVVTLDMSQPTRALNAALMDDDEEEEEEEQGERREAKDEVGGDEGEGGFETEGADVFEMHDCQTILFGHGPTEKLMLLGGDSGHLVVYETDGLASYAPPVGQSASSNATSMVPWGLLPGPPPPAAGPHGH